MLVDIVSRSGRDQPCQEKGEFPSLGIIPSRGSGFRDQGEHRVGTTTILSRRGRSGIYALQCLAKGKDSAIHALL